jgi:hypothetical protein
MLKVSSVDFLNSSCSTRVRAPITVPFWINWKKSTEKERGEKGKGEEREKTRVEEEMCMGERSEMGIQGYQGEGWPLGHEIKVKIDVK